MESRVCENSPAFVDAMLVLEILGSMGPVVSRQTLMHRNRTFCNNVTSLKPHAGIECSAICMYAVVSDAGVSKTVAANGTQLRGKDQSKVIPRQLSGRHPDDTRFPGISTRLNFIDFVEILREHSFRVGPDTEVPEFPLYFLCPLADSMCKEQIFWICFAGCSRF